MPFTGLKFTSCLGSLSKPEGCGGTAVVADTAVMYVAEDMFREMAAYCLLCFYLGHQLPFQRCFPQTDHSNILQNFIMLWSPRNQALVVFYISSLSHLSAGIFILFNLTHLWVFPGTMAVALHLAITLTNLPWLCCFDKDSQQDSFLL